MKKTLLTGIVCFLMFHLMISFCFAEQKQKNEVRNAIVKIYTVSSEPDYYSPWTLGFPENSTGSGCIIKGERILTNAHVVSNQKFIQVQLYGSPNRYNAQVLHVSHDVDLALLTVEDKTFFSSIKPLDFGGLPETLQEVLVYGYPTGGDSLSITKGVLSRVVYEEYVHSGYVFMAGQIDAAVNPGNSGGPVIVDDKVVGVVMQKINSKETENISYMVPSPVIQHFLKDIEDGYYNSFPEIGFVTQDMENLGTREKYGLQKGQTGALVIHVYWNSPAQGIVNKGDVVLSIDEHEIANNETVEFRPQERITYTHYSDMHQVGDEVNLKILRDGKINNIKYPLKQTGEDTSLVASKQYDHLPRYFIFAGIVFSPLTENLICEWDKCNAPLELLKEKDNRPTKSRQEVVVAVQVLPADVNKGFHNLGPWVVRKVNGKEFKDFKEFYNLVITSQEPFLIFEDDEDFQVVIDRIKAKENHQSILETYNINKDSSQDIGGL